MVTLEQRIERRRRFMRYIQDPVLLMAGGERPRNYPDNTIPYRADSNFLYFFADPEPGSAALFDPDSGETTLYLRERTSADALWHGAVPSLDDMRRLHGADRVEPLEGIEGSVARIANDRKVQTVAVADPRATRRANQITAQSVDFFDPAKISSPHVVRVLGRLRLLKDDEEIAQMRSTAAITAEAHIAAMRATRPGVTEQELAGIVDGIFAQHGCVPAYNSILSVRGEVLHNHSHDNVVAAEDIVLLDAGAENRYGYCSDITRCWPGNGRFSAIAGDIYDIVLAAETAAIQMVAPGVRYRDIHMKASAVIADGLAGLGLLRGNVDNLVENGVHAAFFPHGVGHLIGLDVHDMEAFGDAIAYAEGRQRSSQFGTGYLRLDLDLEPGMVFTIEPGIYFVPAILRGDEFRRRFGDQVDWTRAEAFLQLNGGRGFGGIRIEDDVLCTAGGAEVLTTQTPKQRSEIESAVGAA